MDVPPPSYDCAIGLVADNREFDSDSSNVSDDSLKLQSTGRRYTETDESIRSTLLLQV